MNTPIKCAKALSEEEKRERYEQGVLCKTCGGTGYKGRIGTYELLIIDDNIANDIKNNKSVKEIEITAIKNGMLTLMEYGIELVKMKLTTISELLRVCK
tara:strand:- start:271 stop:567 length:297 start_codon:yes stop_codon:yes gene_type:complete